MKPLIHSDTPVTLVGGAPVTADLLARATAIAPMVIGADGGGEQAASLGANVSYVIGDMDSGGDVYGAKTLKIDEQESTDLDKCLYATSAPYYLGVGFTGGALDHQLAACHSLLRTDKRVILIGVEDICFRAPPTLLLTLPRGTRISLFPMGAVSGTSTGLKWPIDGIKFSPDVKIGTSNETVADKIELAFDQPHMLVILPARHLETVVVQLFSNG